MEELPGSLLEGLAGLRVASRLAIPWPPWHSAAAHCRLGLLSVQPLLSNSHCHWIVAWLLVPHLLDCLHSRTPGAELRDVHSALLAWQARASTLRQSRCAHSAVIRPNEGGCHQTCRALACRMRLFMCAHWRQGARHRKHGVVPDSE